MLSNYPSKDCKKTNCGRNLSAISTRMWGKSSVLLRGRLMMRTAVAALAVLSTPAAAWAETAGMTHAALPPPDPVATATAQVSEYRIGPHDTLDINVFGVDALTRTVQVDAAGQIDFPLIGAVPAAARTTRELGQDIALRLNQRYLEAPQVSVMVKTSVTQRFTVEGSVENPGVFELPGRMTLLQAIATARGLNETGNPRHVVVFRTVDGQRRAGLANLSAIRAGRTADPQIYAGDVIVVGSSRGKSWLRNIIGVTPLFNLLLL
jgi:polysaccharide export outer membrane protein